MTPTMTDLGAGRGWLTPAAAASIARIDRALGHALQITEAGRTWGRQWQHWLVYQRDGYPIALHPDTPSIHQLGAAIDSDEAQQHLDLMAEHGWIRTVYRNGKLVEPWHFEYDASRDQHRNDPAPSATPTVTLEDDMTIIIAQREDAALAKGRYIGGGKIQEITKHENTLFRAAQKENRDAVIYATVPNATYAALLKGQK